MGAASRPAGAQVSRQRSNQPRWLITAGVCLAVSIAYLCISLTEAIRGDERSLPAVLAISPQLNSASVAAAADAAPDSQPTAESEASAPRPMAPGPSAGVGYPELLSAIRLVAGEESDHVSVSVRRISDGRSASLHGDVQWYAASLFKLAVLYEIEKLHFEGTLAYDDRVSLAVDDFAQDLGTAGHLNVDADGTVAVEDLLRPMIEISDNVSAVALMHLVGSSNIDATLRTLGIGTMSVNSEELWTTADDISRLMEAIYTGEGLGRTEREHMRELLLAQTIRGGIPGALSDEVKDGLPIGNKTGTWDGAQHDVAFIEAQSGAYVIAVLTDGTYAGWQAMHRVSQTVYDAMRSFP